MQPTQLTTPKIDASLQEAFEEIQQPRSNYALEHFVIGDCSGSKTREYAQIVEELRRAYSGIKRGLLEKQKAEIERDDLLASTAKTSQIEAAMKDLDIEEIQAALIGKLREFSFLYAMWEKYPKYSHAELEAGELDYWTVRLRTQAARDIIASRTGISVSSQHGMERAKLAPVPQLHELIAPTPDLRPLPKQENQCLPSA